MFVPGTNSWAVIGAATTARHFRYCHGGRVLFPRSSHTKSRGTPEVTQATGASQEAAALEAGTALETTTQATEDTPEATTP